MQTKANYKQNLKRAKTHIAKLKADKIEGKKLIELAVDGTTREKKSNSILKYQRTS